MGMGVGGDKNHSTNSDMSAVFARRLFERMIGRAPRREISLTQFSERAYRSYKHAAHLDKLDDLLTQVSEYIASGGVTGIGRLIISMPPRHGKTQKISRIYPSWHLGNYPDHRVMLVSYGDCPEVRAACAGCICCDGEVVESSKFR